MSACRISSVILLSVVALTGCVHAVRDTTGFAIVDSATVEAPLQEAWQTTKSVLLDRQLVVITRDKRGVFVAQSAIKRRRFVPHRTTHTLVLEPQSENATRITIETMKQVFGVTPLTYYGWHDRETTDNSEALAILAAVKQEILAAPSS